MVDVDKLLSENKNSLNDEDRSENLDADQELNNLSIEAGMPEEKELGGDRANPQREQQSRKDDDFEENPDPASEETSTPP